MPVCSACSPTPCRVVAQPPLAAVETRWFTTFPLLPNAEKHWREGNAQVAFAVVFRKKFGFAKILPGLLKQLLAQRIAAGTHPKEPSPQTSRGLTFRLCRPSSIESLNHFVKLYSRFDISRQFKAPWTALWPTRHSSTTFDFVNTKKIPQSACLVRSAKIACLP